MKQLIERYVYDVTRRLAENDRTEVAKELESNIIDMLPENPTEQQIVETLTELGDPRVMAEQYRGKPRYLISPAVFDMYIQTLKLVVPIVAGVLACLGIISTLFNMDITFSLAKLIGNAFGMAFSGALQAVIWITIGFAVYDFLEIKKDWTIAKLPEIIKIPENKKHRISRAESIATIIMTIFFTTLYIAMVLRNEWFFVFISRDNQIFIPFSEDALHRSIPYIIIACILGVTVGLFQLFYARWTWPLFAINTVYAIIWMGIVIYIINWPDLINPGFKSAILPHLNFNENDLITRIIESNGQLIRNIITTLAIFGTTLELITSAIKTWRTTTTSE